MGGSYWSDDDYRKKVDDKASRGVDTFAYHSAVRAGRASGVHPTLQPRGVKMRESRDSVEHPVTLPIITGLDTTGSMAVVPEQIQLALPKLMGAFLNDKASGKKYLGEAYPAIMIGAVDDYPAQVSRYEKGEGALQVGQFESGTEIDDNLTNLWLTGNGGGTYQESYDLLLYFAARHTVHDHWEKRGRKGYIFLIGDEMGYPSVEPDAVRDVIGDHLQAPIPFKTILEEATERYEVFFIIPNMTNHYTDPKLEKWWVEQLGQQHVVKLQDPNKICEMIVSLVAINEAHASLEDLETDSLVDSSMKEGLVKFAAGTIQKVSADRLPDIAGPKGSGVERL